jgi:hypothetical protein
MTAADYIAIGVLIILGVFAVAATLAASSNYEFGRW